MALLLPSDLNVARYRRFSEFVLDAECSIAILSSSGEPIRVDGSFAEATAIYLQGRGVGNVAQPSIRVLGGVRGPSYALHPIEFTGQADPCLLLLKISKGEQRHDKLKTLMHEIATAIADDYATYETLGGLSDELSVRYEELNLLYRFDESATGGGHETAAQSIARILDTCRDYLPVDMIGVIVPGEQLQMSATALDFDPALADTLLGDLRKSRFLQLKIRPQSIVINHDEIAELSSTFASLPYKTVIAPLIGLSNNVVGMLVMANGLDAPDFTISDRKLTELVAAEMSKILQANRDRLTGLYNRKAFEARLDRLILDAHNAQSKHVLLYMDLDRFKLINDIAGHTAGDQLLVQGSSLFLDWARPDWFVARLGDDEFGVLVENASMSAGRRIAETVRRQVNAYRFVWDDRTFQTTGSLSVVPITGTTSSPAQVLAAADVACQLAKDTGRDSVRCYDPNDHILASYHERLQNAGAIREALDENRFEIFGQAITPLQPGGDSDHFEILVRLRRRNGKLVLPGVFIPAAEKYGLINEIDRWVVANAIRSMRALDRRAATPRVSCSINLSGTSIGDKAFLDFIVRTIKEAGFPAGRITFEVTETAAISNLAVALHFMTTVRALGCSFALDDFGVGTNSFGNLRSLPLDYVKIDGSFVKSIVGNRLDFAVVRSINEIAHLMGLKTVAEFVENGAIKTMLRDTGIDYAQGFDIDEPSLLVEKYG